MSKVSVIGAGLAGCEAAWALARRGIDVMLYEMKPVKYSPAHHYEGFAELVCSNSLKAMRLNSAAGQRCRRRRERGIFPEGFPGGSQICRHGGDVDF